jgi:hypothetical protein
MYMYACSYNIIELNEKKNFSMNKIDISNSSTEEILTVFLALKQKIVQNWN